jgi:L-ascorbate metabolism protein UlaG (beta-lactamase superfamily)
MELRRLAWAGLEIRAGGKVLVIDLVEDFGRLHGNSAPAGENAPSPAAEAVDVGLLTHMHSDHADVAALSRAPRGAALRLARESASGAPYPSMAGKRHTGSVTQASE